MEVYFKDLISKEKSVDQLVDDLSLVVQGENLSEKSRAEINSLLERLKTSYQLWKNRTAVGAQATDKFLRQNPYAFIGGGIALGLIIGFAIRRRK
jgi:ElaB/YqjD/DUF883 family membrane-anchored ribosome-binding protein